MSKLLEELKKIKVVMPEGDCHVPEWDMNVRLRGFTVKEGRALRNAEPKGKDGKIVDNDAFTYRTIAHSIVDGDERPLANPDGMALIDSLSEATCLKLIRAINGIAGLEDAEKNSATTNSGSTSSD